MFFRLLIQPATAIALGIFLAIPAWAAGGQSFHEKIVKVSEGLAGVSAEFKTEEGLTGLILRGKAAGSDELTGQEIMAFGYPDGTIVAGGAVYSAGGEDLMCKYVSHLNHEVLANADGLYQSQKLKEAKGPVKIVYVFFDPMCGNCRIMRGGELPGWFEKEGVQLLWVPVSIFSQSRLAAAHILESGQWEMNSVFDQNAGRLQPQPGSLNQIESNMKRLLRLHAGQEIPTPFLFWETQTSDNDQSGLDSFVGIPTIEQARALIIKVKPAAPKDYPVMK